MRSEILKLSPLPVLRHDTGGRTLSALCQRSSAISSGSVLAASLAAAAACHSVTCEDTKTCDDGTSLGDGGSEALLAHARRAFDDGDYRWVAEVVMQVVWADPSNTEARALAADAFEQLGYQAESGVWRNVYLSGANELRNGLPRGSATASTSADVVRAIPLDLFFDYLAVRLNPQKAAGRKLVVNWTFPDVDQKVQLTLENSVLSHVMGEHAAKADAAVTMDRATLDRISLQQTTFPAAMQAGQARIEGDVAAVGGLLGLLDTFTPAFEIVTPLGSEKR